ncbi:hypothetical protein NDU88_003305 [Pleurodeles waltl]|uniref:Uncharacterized protein n=1 Tax=Pleurodeles waltl TaxID=8319 RepID=A0AAV7LRQ8_PLEWA|nr:hypothetical protein NDU88_003305 [Pleurodeles waltl]
MPEPRPPGVNLSVSRLMEGQDGVGAGLPVRVWPPCQSANTLLMRGLTRSAAGPRTTWRYTEGPERSWNQELHYP